MSGTGTIRGAAPMFFMDIKNDEITVSFQNNSGEVLTQGQEVVMEAAGTITKRTTAAQFPLGIVVVGAPDGERATVNVLASYTAEAEAGEDLAAGDFVFQNGTKNTNGLPVYMPCGTGEQSVAVVMKGGLTGAAIKVIILKAVVTVV